MAENESEANEEMPLQPRIKPDIYFAERKSLNDIESMNAERYDKALLTLSAGALGLSITFLKDIAPKPLPLTK